MESGTPFRRGGGGGGGTGKTSLCQTLEVERYRIEICVRGLRVCVKLRCRIGICVRGLRMCVKLRCKIEICV